MGATATHHGIGWAWMWSPLSRGGEGKIMKSESADMLPPGEICLFAGKRHNGPPSVLGDINDRAPSGTQLEVPIPEMGQNGQKKYQINLKSRSGPIRVLLINKQSSSSQPVAFPVPPPDDLTQPSSQPSTPRTPQKPSPSTQSPPGQPSSERGQGLQHMPAPDLASAGAISGDIIDELMSSDVFSLLRLSPTPADYYNFNLDENEGVCDLFDVQILNY
ncbi:transcription factor E2F5-like [Saccopteryx leptura]|uniref:transcription factor E2F5-like n=1 Tax=Saccopteryx leptura TaxID=249018 RepID=UPI00339BCA2F